MIEDRIDNGIDTAMMQVLRQLPRNTQDQRGREAGGDHRFAHHAADGGPNEARLVEQRRDLQVLRQDLRDDRQLRQQGADDVQSRRTAVLDDGDQHAAFAVLAHDIGLRREAVAHMRHFGEIGGRAVAGQHRNIVEPGDGVRRTVGGEHVLRRADLGGAGRQHQILRVDRIDHVVRGQALGQQGAGVEIDRNHALLAAERPGYRDSRNGHQPRTQEIHRGIEHRLLGHAWDWTSRAG